MANKKKSVTDEAIPEKSTFDMLFDMAAEKAHDMAKKGYMGTRRKVVEEKKDKGK